MNNSPIGIFDSGLGGLSVWAAIRKRLPAESLLYYGDGKNCPYGNQPPSEVACHVGHAIEELVRRNVKLIVVACNTATAAAINELRDLFPDLIVIGIEPALKVAADRFPGGKIGVMVELSCDKPCEKKCEKAQ